MNVASTIETLLDALDVPEDRRAGLAQKMLIGVSVAVMRQTPPPADVDFGEETDEEIEAGLVQVATYLEGSQAAQEAVSAYFSRIMEPMRSHMSTEQHRKLDVALAATGSGGSETPR